MIMSRCCVLLFCFLAALMVTEGVSSGDGGEEGSSVVVCSDGILSVTAREIRSEDLMKDIGEKCGIKIVAVGDVFSEVPVSLNFQKQTVRKGIERVLRVVNIPNYLLHFQDSDNGSGIIEIDLIGKKGGERHLTEGSVRKARVKKPAIKPAKRKKDRKEDAKIQQNFLNIMDEILNSKLGDGEEPDPSEILRLFKEVVPPEMRDQIPPEVLEELEKLD